MNDCVAVAAKAEEEEGGQKTVKDGQKTVEGV